MNQKIEVQKPPMSHGTLSYRLPASGNFTFTQGAPVQDSFPAMLRAFARSAALRADVREAEAGYWLARVDGIQGAWGDGTSREDALSELEDAIVGWVEVKLARGSGLPFAYSADFRLPQSA